MAVAECNYNTPSRRTRKRRTAVFLFVSTHPPSYPWATLIGIRSVHDGDMVSMLAALGLFEDPYDLPIDHIVPERNWKTSQITPMGGRILLERLTCASSPYIRFNVNDGIMPLPGCSDGPGGSCAMAEFAALVMKSGEAAGDFKEMCGLGDEAPSALTFLRQPAFPDK